jgi:hypothetical protein
MRLRVVTLNVWNTEGDARRPELINKELKRLDPDLVAFQQVVQTPKVKMTVAFRKWRDIAIREGGVT